MKTNKKRASKILVVTSYLVGTLIWIYLSTMAFFNLNYILGIAYLFPAIFMSYSFYSFIKPYHKNPSWCRKRKPCKKYDSYMGNKNGYPCLPCNHMSAFGAKYK